VSLVVLHTPTWYWSRGHTEQVWHAVSEASAQLPCTAYLPTVHGEHGAHTASLVKVHDSREYVPAGQIVQRSHTRSVVNVGAELS
jgi:hypothetical protein